MATSKLETLIVTLQRLELELLSDADTTSAEALPEMERALDNLKATLRLQYRTEPEGELEKELRERSRMQRAVEMLRQLPATRMRKESAASQSFSFADLVSVAESAAERFAVEGLNQ